MLYSRRLGYGAPSRRSRWMRSMYTTSSSGSASSSFVVTWSAPRTSGRAGMSVGGAMTVTSQPMILSAGMRLPHTRECPMSPTMPTCSLSRSPFACQMEYRSSRACVGCWCLPSPASMTWTPDTSAILRGTPACLSRTMIMSTL